MFINKIIIVGGGSAGWMTAAAIAYKFPHINLTLIESPKTGIIGVGESTLGHINRYFDLLDLKDHDWMKHCNATYKNSIQFTDFYKKGTRFQYPFSTTTEPSRTYGYLLENTAEYDFVPTLGDFFAIKLLCPSLTYNDFARFSNFNTVLAETNKQSLDDIENFSFKNDTAYHLNADMFGQRLKQLYCSNINHIVDHIVDVVVNDDGVCCLKTSDAQYSADLYIDCSGFKSLLIEQSLGIPFQPFDNLINDAAVAARIDYQSEEEQARSTINVTDCTAIDHGWLWHTPLWDRLGRGYVYSSQFLTPDEAELEFRQAIGWTGDVRHIKFRHGYHQRAWYKNVLAIGLSYGFIEPLEATGLMTTHENILKFIQILGQFDQQVTHNDITMFNNACEVDTLDMANFVAMHYACSRREDSEYWRFLVNKNDTDKYIGSRYMSKYNRIEDEMKVILTHNNFDYRRWEGMIYILAGMNYSPTTLDYLKHVQYPMENLDKKLRYIKDVIKLRFDKTLSLPTNYEFMKRHIYF